MDLAIFPFSFFLSVIALVPCGLFAWKHRRQGWGLPMLAVLCTTAVWYHGDGIYNDYEEYRAVIGDDALDAGWWQVLLFVVTFALLVQPVHRKINQRFLKQRSCLISYAETGRIKHRSVQAQIDLLAKPMLGTWLILMTFALIKTNFDFEGMFAPYLSDRANPWLRGRIGHGISAMLSLAGYIQIILTAGFGVLAAVAKTPKTRMMAITVCCLAFPYYIFDRTRNTMIATMLPGLLAWVFFGLQGGVWKKGGILIIAFMVVDMWFSFVAANRGSSTIAAAFRSDKGAEEAIIEVVDGEEVVTHQGLTMFSELGYMNAFFDNGTYSPTWGGRYFAEVANVIPRALWKNKPRIGYDYARARGFMSDKNVKHTGGISASIATGMIGQGVVNFGRFVGPMAAALLMSIWVAILARQDLRGNEPARLLLCMIGMILTFNMGRDITLLVIYPYAFGWMLILAMEWWQAGKRGRNISESRWNSRPAQRS